MGEALYAPADLSWGRRDDVIAQPDVFVVSGQHGRGTKWEEMRDFLVFVEVLSPATARYDRFTKRRLYQDMGVPLYWILDPESRRAEIWTPEAITPVIESERLLWLPAGAVDPLVVDLSTAFAGRT